MEDPEVLREALRNAQTSAEAGAIASDILNIQLRNGGDNPQLNTLYSDTQKKMQQLAKKEEENK